MQTMMTSGRFKQSKPNLDHNASTMINSISLSNRKEMEFVPYAQERDHLGRIINSNFSDNFDLLSLMKIETNDGPLISEKDRAEGAKSTLDAANKSIFADSILGTVKLPEIQTQL